MALLDVQVAVLANQNLNFPHDWHAAETVRQRASKHRSISGLQKPATVPSVLAVGNDQHPEVLCSYWFSWPGKPIAVSSPTPTGLES